MVIVSSYHENKENLNKQNSFENSFNYAEKIQTSLKILFNILSDFFPKTTFKDLENSVKKVFNLVVKTPTEFNKKPLDELYQKLDKIYNRINDNDESLSTMRSFYGDGGIISPKMADLNVSCIKFNH